jgi:predicted nucleic acid-binding protein
VAVPVLGKVVLDTNVFIDYLRQDLHADWVFGRAGSTVRFLSSVVLMELRLDADTPRRGRAIDRIKAAFPRSRLIAPTLPRPRAPDAAWSKCRASSCA